MAFTESLRTWWRGDRPLSQRPLALSRVEQSAPGVPTEYLSLYTYLERRYASTVVLTFEQMEALLGFALPAPASIERDWWTSDAGRARGHSEAWLGAGRTATPNLAARTVAFERLP